MLAVKAWCGKFLHPGAARRQGAITSLAAMARFRCEVRDSYCRLSGSYSELKEQWQIFGGVLQGIHAPRVRQLAHTPFAYRPTAGLGLSLDFTVDNAAV
ncbi:hypothetical protein RHECNPAF_9300111 [Rhizobium etli CNPAF512]|nr:hypothetical protein RHECNPAF_9300111 [Rhizobium etli CNPAF512]